MSQEDWQSGGACAGGAWQVAIAVKTRSSSIPAAIIHHARSPSLGTPPAQPSNTTANHQPVLVEQRVQKPGRSRLDILLFVFFFKQQKKVKPMLDDHSLAVPLEPIGTLLSQVSYDAYRNSVHGW
jgi:hypothetical protein